MQLEDLLNLVNVFVEGVVKNDFPDLNVKLPIKKKKGKELSKRDKRINKKFRKERVVVEHSFAKIKKYGIMKNEFRNNLYRYDNIVSIVSGFVNFKLLFHDGFNLDNFISWNNKFQFD